MKKINVFLFMSLFCIFFFGQKVFADGFHYFTDAIDISHTNTGTWHTIDVSSYIPAGSSGVILHLVNINEDGADFAVRKIDSSTINLSTSIMRAGTFMYAFCGVNSDRTFESFIENTDCKIFLVGYSDDDVHYFGEEKDISLSTIEEWTEIDVSDKNVPINATGVIIRVNGGGGNYTAGIRALGSNDDRTSSGGSVVYRYGNYTYLLCGINEQRIFEGKVQNTEIAFNLVGYTLPPVSFFQDAIDITITNTKTWTDIDLDTLLPPAANGIIYEINNTSNSVQGGVFRQKGSTNDSSNCMLRNRAFTQGACGIDASQMVEGYHDLSAVEFYLIGYSQINDPTPPGDISNVRDGLNGDIDEQYSTIKLNANWSPSTDNESDIGRYLCAVGTSPGGVDILGWSDAGIDTFATLSGLALSVGSSYYFNIKAANTQGLESNITSSDGIEIITDPSAPANVSNIWDGLSPGSDEGSTYSLSQLSANWSEATDNESGILRYEYAIDTIQGGTTIVGWTDNGLSTSVTLSELNLTVGKVYYSSVKAINTQEMESSVSSSNGIEILADDTPPLHINEVRDGIGEDSDHAYLTTELWANWDATSDPESGINNYYYAIGTTAGGTDIVAWTDNDTNTSILHTGLSLNQGTMYYVSVRAENVAGMISAVTTSDGILIKELEEDEYLANSGTSFDIQVAVDAAHAAGGGKVHIPEGIYNVSDDIILYSNISIIGAGIDKTILHLDRTAFFNAERGGDSLIRISGATMYGYYIIRYRSVKDFRIDHCHFIATRNSSYLLHLNNLAGYHSTRGVVDNCIFSDDDYLETYGVHCGPKCWPQEERGIDVLGTQDAIFVEDCYFDEIENHAVAAFNGANYVFRYNYSTRCGSLDGHGPVFELLLGDTSQRRGTRCYEIYNNQFVEPPEAGFDERWDAMGLRGGGGVVYNNSFTNFRWAIRLEMETGSVVPTGGTYPGIDQIHDMWIWNNTHDGSNDLIHLYANNSEELIQEDRDYFLRAPSMELDGFTYTPYTYPHPLRSNPIIGNIEKNLTANSNNQNIKVYPNPSPGEFTIEIDTLEDDIYIQIISETGQILFTKKYYTSDNNIIDRINLSMYNNGIYFLKVVSKNVSVRKIILTK